MIGSFVAFDLETTGFIPGVDEIIEIGAVKIVDGNETERFHSLICGARKIPASITRLTGITNEDVRDKPLITEVLPEFLAFVGSLPLAAHNASFDISFLSAVLGRIPAVPVIDTVEAARLCFPLAPAFSLKRIAAHLTLGGNDFHRALNDAIIAGRLLVRCMERIREWDLGLLRQVNLLFESDTSGLALILRDTEKEVARMFPDKLIRESMLYLSSEETTTGLFSTNQTRATIPEPETAELSYVLGPAGPMAEQITNYQHRTAQLRMAEGVRSSFAGDAHMVVEAGTGTGKSLAYLVPAAYWTAYSGEKVAITTHTINLQEQLWEKDIPLLRTILPFDFSAALVKGRGNYLCLRKWQGLWYDLKGLNPEERLELSYVLTWLSLTLTGDKTELSLRPKGMEIWSRFCADSDSCLGNRCRYFNKGCFVMRARRKAENADILILNHSLLMSDIKTDNMVLPAFKYLVIDEAHHLEDSATEHLGDTINAYALDMLYRMLRPSGSPSGLLTQVRSKEHTMAGKFALEALERLDQARTKSIEYLELVLDASHEFFDVLSSLATDVSETGGMTVQARLKPEVRNFVRWTALKAAGENLTGRLQTLGLTVQTMCQILAEADDEELAGLIKDLGSSSVMAKGLGTTVDRLLNLEDENQVVWIDKNERSCSLCGAPINVGPLLREQLFNKVKSVILTSATLAVNNSFEHLLERIGLDADTSCLQVESPFDYQHQAMICIPRDLPDPSKTGGEGFVQAAASFLIDLVRTTEGRTLILFTAHKMLRDVYHEIKPQLEELDIRVLGHNIDGNRGRLVEEFVSNPRTVLLGASSFWEGVDIQGEALSCVVIVKLPFWPPSIPTIEARIEKLEEQKKNGFQHLSIPQAVIRLKQGFGRLIRTKEDCGVVVILDNRILEKRYGRKFLNSLPLKTHVRGDSDFVLRKIKTWLSNKDKVC